MVNVRFRGNESDGGQGAGLVSKIPKQSGTQMKSTIAVEGGTKKTAFAC
jgi:hypothetical protein